MLQIQPSLLDSSSVLSNFYDSAQSSNLGYIVSAETALANGDLSLAEGYLGNVSPQNDIESNYVDFYSVYIHYKDSTFTTSDSILLKSLVNGCPVRDGGAVLKARTLNSILYFDYNLYSDYCSESENNKMIHTTATNSKNLNFEVFPNPNDGTFTITLSGNNSPTKSAEVIINDVIGNQISENNLNLLNNSVIFNINLSNGIYLISIKDDDGNRYKPKKITIIK